MAMNVGSGGGDDEVIVDINTTPLIDVMLVLLIMLIITIPIQTHAVKMDMPVAQSSAPPKPPTVVELVVDAEGRIGWNGEVVASDADLDARLAAAAQAADPPEIHLRPDRAVAYKHVVHVMAAAQRLGVTKIGVVGSEQFMQ